ncbi:hypothetical protein Agub_g7327, partial [Astrephomene gubernaculifera]
AEEPATAAAEGLEEEGEEVADDDDDDGDDDGGNSSNSSGSSSSNGGSSGDSNSDVGSNGGSNEGVARRRGISEVAVGALLVAARRLQLGLPGSALELAALRRLTGTFWLFFSGRQLATLLTVLTKDHHVLEARVLHQIAGRLGDGECRLSPEDAIKALTGLADQAYIGLSPFKLHAMVGPIFLCIRDLDPEARLRAEQRRRQRRNKLINADDMSAAGAADAATSASDDSVRDIASMKSTHGSEACSRERYVTFCQKVEPLLERLQLDWAAAEGLAAVRRELSAFAASGGAQPLAVFMAWRTFIRRGRVLHRRRQLLQEASSRAGPAALSAADLDDFIEEARRELLTWAKPGSSILESVLAMEEG